MLGQLAEYHTVINGQPILWLDIAAALFFFCAWFGYSDYADRQYHRRTNLMRTMDDMRKKWMQEMLLRENRVMDATLIGNLLRSIAFFASTTILILVGIITVLGTHNEEGLQLIRAIPFTVGSTAFMWEAKLLLLGIIFVYAFFKLTWSLRQYNYTCILVGATPHPNHIRNEHKEYALRVGDLIANAGRHFNMGLRAYYFGVATVAWFINGAFFIVMTTLVVYELFRREFRSHAVATLDGVEGI
ncbi:MAG: DUF599 domain-containing protein [Alphaproteobacteria bacterium]|nr:DUF599 domain-containing protein [Alphaproteobacteria bacterium]